MHPTVFHFCFAVCGFSKFSTAARSPSFILRMNLSSRLCPRGQRLHLAFAVLAFAFEAADRLHITHSVDTVGSTTRRKV